MKLIVGLGNPGEQYARTRHNAGFMLLDRFAMKAGVGLGEPERARFQGLCREGNLGGEKLLLLKPMTYMNRSGQSVAEALRFYKIDPVTEMMVLVDDLYLPAGKIRIRADGGAAGHNGLKGIARVVGGDNYPRLRIGIDPPGIIKQVDYVLGRFTPEQEAQLGTALNTGADALTCWVREGIAKAMTQFNR